MNEFIDGLRASVGDDTLIAVGGGLWALYVVNWCRIYRRAGHSFALGFLMALPGVNLLLQTAFAWLPWPVAREARELRIVRKAVHRADAHALKKAA